MPELTRAQIAALIEARFPDNAARQITEARLREVLHSLADSVLFLGEAGASEPEPDPALLALDVLFSGHSLVGPSLASMVDRMIAESGGTGHADRSFITGSSMAWRWDHDADTIEVHAREALAAGEVGIFVVTEAGPIENHVTWSGSNTYLKLFYDLAVGGGCDHFYFYQTWAELISGTPGASIGGDSNADKPWRWRPMMDLHFWEAVADHVNGLRTAGQPEVLCVPMGLAWGRLYDAVQLGQAFEVEDFAADLFSDTIHPNLLGFYYMACVHFATIFRRSPVGLPATLLDPFGNPFSPAPSAGLAALMQNCAWDVVRSYPRSGVAGATLAPTITFAAMDTKTPAIGVEVKIWAYATGWPQPAFGYSWRLNETQVSTAATYTPTGPGMLKCIVSAGATSFETEAFEVPPVEVSDAPFVMFDDATYLSGYSVAHTAQATFVVKIRLPAGAPIGTGRILPPVRFFGGSTASRGLYFNVADTSFATVAEHIAALGLHAGDEVAIMLALHSSGGLNGGKSVVGWVNGVEIFASTNVTGNLFGFNWGWAVSDYAFSEPPAADPVVFMNAQVKALWFHNSVALDPATHWGDFFGAGNALIPPDLSTGIVAGTAPTFYQAGNAAKWNSGLGIVGTYTMHGAATDV